MNQEKDWRVQFQHEIDLARAAGMAGNEGRARVCARRAAGIAIREHLRRSGQVAQGHSAFDLLHMLQAMPGVSPLVRDAAGLLLERVTPEHKLPMQADLIAEACRLADDLLG